MGFVGFKVDSSLFVKHTSTDKIFAHFYVDDILITGSCSQAVDQIIQTLGKEFLVRDLCPLSYFLGVEVISQSTGYHLSHCRYFAELLQGTGMTNSNECLTPKATTPSLSKAIVSILVNPKTTTE